MDSHEIQCEKEYWSDLCADVGTLPSVQDRDGTTQFGIFSESTLEERGKVLHIRRASCRFDQQPRFSEDAVDVDHEHKSW